MDASPRGVDSMVCRSCGREERASEGYPCTECGTFICLICGFRGETKCRDCGGSGGASTEEHRGLGVPGPGPDSDTPPSPPDDVPEGEGS